MSEKGKKASQLTPLRQILEQVLPTFRKDSARHLAQISTLWDQAVGDVISENAQPAAMKDKILIVHVSSSPWIQQLQFLKREIMHRINQSSDQVVLEDIKFKIGPVV